MTSYDPEFKIRTCGTCIFLVTDDGEPYCLAKDEYTYASPNDSACREHVEGEHVKVEDFFKGGRRNNYDRDTGRKTK